MFVRARRQCCTVVSNSREAHTVGSVTYLKHDTTLADFLKNESFTFGYVCVCERGRLESHDNGSVGWRGDVIPEKRLQVACAGLLERKI